MPSILLNTKKMILIVIVLSLGVLTGWTIATVGSSYQTLLFIGLLLALVLAFMTSRNPLLAGFTLWIWFFILGYRTIHLSSEFSLHPLVALLLLLAVLLMISLRSAPGVRLKLPTWLWIFSLFWLWGFVPGLWNGFSLARMLPDALNFFLIIPLWFIMLYLARRARFWQVAALTFLGSGVL
ncbi:MAG: hypothetical protein ACYC6L_17240, partial [Anaerolineae bacterium]